jgi:enoyl-[acyl-carrier-protein] reductase (NADH)
VRVCGIWTAGVAGTLTEEKLRSVGGGHAPTPDVVEAAIASRAALRRAPRIENVAEVATFLASDRAAGMTGSVVNVTSGLVLA